MEFCLWMIVLSLVGIQNILCIIIGIKVGITLNTNKVELPKVELNPVKVVKEHKANKEAKMERDKIETILANIENYDGTGNNQEDVPWR
jgi:hypothetical protein